MQGIYATTAKELRHMLDRFYTLFDKNPVVPALEYVQVKDKELRFTNLRESMVFSILSEAEGFFLFKPVYQFVKALAPDTPVALKWFDNDKLQIKTDRTTIQMTVDFREADYPKFHNHGTPANWLKIDQLDKLELGELVKALGYASNDEIRPAMTCVALSDEIAATNGHQLLRIRRGKPQPNTFLLNPKLIKGISKELGIIVHLSEDQQTLRFQNGNFTCYQRVMDEKYPSYRNVWPEAHVHKLIVNTQPLWEAIQQLKPIAHSITKQLRLTLMNNELILSVEDYDESSKGSVNLPAICHSKQAEALPFIIGCNLGYLEKLIKSQLSQKRLTTIIDFTTENRAMVINGEQLLMPVMLNNFVSY